MTERSIQDRFISAASDVPFWYIDIGEEEARLVNESISAKCFSMGPVSAKLEAEFAAQLDVPYAVFTSSGTAALA